MKWLSEDYALEYGNATLELHTTDLAPGSRVLILDDVLATGGTLGAAARLFERCGIDVAGVGVVMELDELGGRSALGGHRVQLPAAPVARPRLRHPEGHDDLRRRMDDSACLGRMPAKS